MKTYEQLTREERVKLLTFMTMKNNFHLQNVIILCTSTILVVVGFISMMTFYLPLFIGGGLTMFFGALLATVVVKNVKDDAKRYKLIFGHETIFSDFFGIKPSDLKDMKLRWTKEK